jgi:hypothetical protein
MCIQNLENLNPTLGYEELFRTYHIALGLLDVLEFIR